MSRQGMLGFAAAACVACCAGPLLATVGGIAALGVFGTLAFGVVALIVTGVAIVSLIALRRRLRSTEPDDAAVELSPTRRT